MLEETNIFLPFSFIVFDAIWFQGFDSVVFKFVFKRDVLQKATKHNSYHSISGEGFPTPSQQSVKASPANRILLCGWTVTVGGTVIKQ